MNVTLPNGAVIQGVPDGTSKDVIAQKAISAGLATAEDFGMTPAQQPIQADPIAQPEIQQPQQLPPQSAQLQQQLGGFQTFAKGLGEMITGSGRATLMTEELPELQESGILSTAPTSTVARLSPALLTATNPDEIVGIIQSSVPEVAVTYDKDAQGNVFPILTNRETGARAQVNRPGISALDVLQGLGLASVMATGGGAGAGMSVAGRAGLRGAIAGGMATGLEATQAAQGGEFNHEDVAFEVAGAGVGSLAGDALQAFSRMRMQAKTQRRLINPETNLPTPELQKALDKRGIDIGALSEGELPLVMGDKKPSQIVDDIIKHKLRTGQSSDALHQFRLDDSGRIVTDKLGTEAKRQGFQEGDIASIKGADKPTSNKMKKMLKMKRQIQADKSKALDFRPSDVIGDSAMDRFNFIRNRADKLRLQLDDLAKKDTLPGERLLDGPDTGAGLKSLKVNTDSVVRDYEKGIEKLGIVSKGTPPELNFTKSAISEDPTSQDIISRVTRILSKGDNVTAADAHMVKRQIDTMLDHSKKSPAGLTDAGKKFAASIRKSVNDSIRDVSPQYAKINDELSKALGSLEKFDNALKSIDPNAEGANEAVGQTLRRLVSNAQSRVELKAALSELSQTANDFGGNFKEDIGRLVQFNNMLDDRFGATATGSAQGIIESAARSGVIGAIKEAAIKKAAEKAEGLIGISDKEAFNVIQKILSREQ
jgi:hypothetical protein